MSEARHIQSMIDFIEREALEKVEELEAAAQEEYDVEKMRVVETEKSKIRAQHEKKKVQVDIDCRVSKANFSKNQRMRVMSERAKVMDSLYEATKESILKTISDENTYQNLLLLLIRESLLSIRASVTISCIEGDKKKISSLIPQVVDWYRNEMKETITLTVSDAALSKEEVWGGVLVSTPNGRIVCNNTLAHRAKTCFEEQLPTVRYHLFTADTAL